MDLLTTVSITISILSVFISINAMLNKRNALRDQVFRETIHRYREPLLQYAVQRLWKYYHDHGDDFVKKYQNKHRKEYEQLLSLPALNTEVRIENTLHYQRGLVKGFYQYVAALHREHILPERIFFSMWTENVLEIIPKILIPIEVELAKEDGMPQLAEELQHKSNDMLRLYVDSKRFTKWRNARMKLKRFNR